MYYLESMNEVNLFSPQIFDRLLVLLQLITFLIAVIWCTGWAKTYPSKGNSSAVVVVLVIPRVWHWHWDISLSSEVFYETRGFDWSWNSAVVYQTSFYTGGGKKGEESDPTILHKVKQYNMYNDRDEGLRIQAAKGKMHTIYRWWLQI